MENSKNAIFADTHLHSEHSFDGHHSVRDICRAAKKEGLSYIAITDHFECGKVDEPIQSDIGRINASVADSAACDSETLRVLRGVEIGQPNCDPETARKVLEANEYDIVLGSVHYINDGEDLYWFDYKKRDAEEVYRTYINDVLTVARTFDYDVLAHMSYPLRYIINRDGVQLDVSKYADIHDEIYKAVIERGKALEVNTKLLWRPGGFLTPDTDMLRRYYELGGRMVTLGSDAHYTNVVGSGIKRTVNILRELGFESHFVYENRQPVELSL